MVKGMAAGLTIGILAVVVDGYWEQKHGEGMVSVQAVTPN
jgi:hypothetical protein